MADETDATGGTAGLRERKREQTRTAILEAAQLLFLAHGGATDPELITMARVAELAGVSERTVYRFFPSRDELDRALVEHDRSTVPETDLRDIRAWSGLIRSRMRHWSARNGDRRVLRSDPQAREFPASADFREERDAATVEAVARLLGDHPLGPRQCLALTAAVQSLVSARAMAISAQRWGLTLAEAGEAHAWAFDVLLDALEHHRPDPWDLEP